MIDYKNKYIVGVTGHRDLLKSEISLYKEKINTYLLLLKNKIDKPLLLISPLADGADRIFIEAGIELGLDYFVILPLPIKLYKNDFSKKSKIYFYLLLENANGYKVCSFAKGNSIKNCKKYGFHRDLQYKKVGKEISKSDELIVLWDGIDNNKLGGTADIVKFRKSIKKSFYLIKVKRNKI